MLIAALVYLISIWTGIHAARFRGKWVDYGFGTILLALYSMPEIWVGILFIGFLTNNKYPLFHWFPTNGLHDMLADSMTFLPTHSSGHWERGWLLDMAWHLCLPLICLSYTSFAFLSKLYLHLRRSNRWVRITCERLVPKDSRSGWSSIVMHFAIASCR